MRAVLQRFKEHLTGALHGGVPAAFRNPVIASAAKQSICHALVIVSAAKQSTLPVFNGRLRRACAFLAVTVLITGILAPAPAHAACTNPAGAEGDVIYNSTSNVPQYCDDVSWIAMVGAQPSGPQGCPSIGNVCSDGSVYAGLSPDGNVPMYTTPADAPGLLSWNDGSTNYVNTAISVCSGGTPGVGASCLTGAANTALLAALGTTPSPAPYVAARYCNSLDVHGQSDWYLPAQDELNVLYVNRLAIGGFKVSAPFPDERYWSSSENIDNVARSQSFASSNQRSDQKELGFSVRCVRKPNNNLTQIVPSGLVGHWRLDETSGTTTATDSSASGNDGTMTGGLMGTDTTSGKSGTALSFDGTADYINTAANPTNPAMGTASLWVKPSVATPAAIEMLFMASGDPAERLYLTRTTTGNLGTRFGTNASDDTGAALPVGTWSYVAGTWDNGNFVVYLNGTQVDSGTYTNFGSVTYCPMIGAYNDSCGGPSDNNSFFSGDIDDVRLYNRALTADEITEIFQATDGIRYNANYRTPEYFDGNRWMAMAHPFPAVSEGLVGHWKLDETTGTTAVNAASPGTHDGTMQNGLSAANESNPGAIVRGLRFDNTDDSIDIAADPAFSLTSFTLASWVYMPSPISAGWKTIIAHNRGGANWMFLGKNDTQNKFHFVWANGATANTVADFAPDSWVHVAGTYDYATNTARIYLNGVLDNTISGGSQPSAVDSLLRIGRNTNDTETFAGLIDDARIYNRALTAAEIAKLYNMGAPVGASTALPQGCPNIGDVCDDGTIYAGLSPDGNVAMFTTPADAGLFSWNDDTANYVDTAMVNCTSAPPGAQASCRTGKANTDFLVNLGTAPSPAPYQAARHCANLVAGGSDDWYLPAQDELDVLYDNRVAIGGFTIAPGTLYRTSSEVTASQSRTIDFSNGTVADDGKSGGKPTRCVRKGPAPRCANPYGLEGAMFYNTTHNVVQYCDGARWVAIGKTN